MPVSIQAGYVCASSDGSPPTPHNSWVAKTISVENTTFAFCDKRDSKFHKLCGRSFRMVDAIVKARNDKVDSLMTQVGRGNDPLGDAEGEEPAPKRARKELIDDVAPIVEVTTPMADGTTVTINVLTTAHHRDKLAVELSCSVLELLAKEPAVTEVGEVRPALSSEH
eukprot:8443326-Pyramimonas_sp.AAC.1